MSQKDIIYDCIIIGAGASGLFFAAGLDKPCRGLVLEKTASPGNKLLMTGGGRCNITHGGDIKDFINCYGEEGKLIRKALYRHSNIELMNFLKENGIPTYEEEDGRVFPKSQKAKDVLDMLLKRARNNGFDIRYNSPVERIGRFEFGHAGSVEAAGKRFYTRSLVIATGGASYPKTGSDGSFLEILKRDLGLEMEELKPALTYVVIKDYTFKDLAGASLEAEVRLGKRKLRGPMLFTHNGLSGPLIINLSTYMEKGDKIYVNFTDEKGYHEAIKRIQSVVTGSKKGLDALIHEMYGLPKNITRYFASVCNDSTKVLARLLTEYEMEVGGLGGFDAAMATKGGVKMCQIDSSTMEIKGKNDLYIIGEALDITGFSGGYNLQFAYSSARVAIDNFKKRLALSQNP